MRRKRLERKMDRALLDAIFVLEAEWKQIQSIIENSIETTDENRYRLQLAEAKYIFLLKEAKHRDLSYLRY